MQARLETRQFPTRVLAIGAILAALAGGGALGYSLKAPVVVSGPTHVVTVPADQQAPAQDSCQRFDGRKGC